jgi:hypothetical protein
MGLANPAASGNHLIWPPLLILIDAPFPSRLSRYNGSTTGNSIGCIGFGSLQFRCIRRSGSQ